jgi:eukaryotic-like serine/threonine-protein kinase
MGGSSQPAPRRLARFDILGEVGQGGAGRVYEAIDRERGTRVALKLLRTPNPQAILLLKKEFRGLQDLSHPNLVTPKELFEFDGQWFVTMASSSGLLSSRT